MPRTLPSGLTTWLNNFPLLESHSTLSVYLPFSEDADTFYYATLPTVLDGEDYRGALKSVGELKLSMGRAADRVEVLISNVDGLQGGIFLQSRDVLRGNVVRIGRLYYNPQDTSTQHHVILFTGTIASVSVDDTDIRLSIVSDLYGGGMVGATRLVSPTCQFKFKDANTCAYSGVETTCNKLYDDAGGCSGRSNQHHFGGALFKDSKAGLQTVVGGPVPAFQLVASSDGVDDTDVEQTTKLVFENCTVETDLVNNRTVVTANGTTIEGDPIQVLYIKPDNSPGTDANFDYDINQNVVRAAGGFHNTVEAINVQTYGMVSGLFAAGSVATGTAGINSSTDQLTFVTSVGDFKVGHGIAIPGAGVSGATLYTTITDITGLVATLADNASTTVAGATIQHDDTPAIQAAIDAAEAAAGRSVMLPNGTYRLRSTLTVTGEVRIFGESKQGTILYSTANEPIITVSKDTISYQGPVIENLMIRGDVSAGSSQDGLVCDDSEVIFMMTVRNVTIEKCGGSGLVVKKCFSSTFEDIYVSNCAGYPILYDAANMPSNLFRRVDAGLLRDSAPTGFRIKAGTFIAQNCNGIYNVVLGSRWAVLGRKDGVDGDTSNNPAIAIWENCNFESYTLSAVHHYFGSKSDFRGVCTFAAQASIILDPAGIDDTTTTITANSTGGFPSSGKIQMELETISYTSINSTQFLGCTRGIDGTTAASHAQFTIVGNKQVKPLVYEVDNVGNYPAFATRGLIEDSCNFNDGPETQYANNQAVHCNDIPPLETAGRGAGVNPGNAAPPLGTYWNSTTSKIEALARADGSLKRIEVNDDRVFPNPGVRWIEVNNTSGGPIDVTLPPPTWYKTQEVVIVKDVAGNAGTHTISIYGGGGSHIDDAGVFTMEEDYQSAIFVPHESDTVNGAWRLIATYPPPGYAKTTGGGFAGYFGQYVDDQTLTGGPLYELSGTIISKRGIVCETDNDKDVGSSGGNRFRTFFVGTSARLPDGSSPSLARNSDVTTGIGVDGSGIHQSVAGAETFTVTSTGVTVTGDVTISGSSRQIVGTGLTVNFGANPDLEFSAGGVAARIQVITGNYVQIGTTSNHPTVIIVNNIGTWSFGASAAVPLTTQSLGGASNRIANYYGSSFLDVSEISTPSNPAAGTRRIYPKSGGWYELNSSGVETALGGGGISGTLTSGRVTLSNGTSAVTDSANLAFNAGSSILTVSGAGNNPHLLITDPTNTIDLRLGTLAGAPDRAIVGTMTNDPLVFYQNGGEAWGLDTNKHFLPYGTTTTRDVGSSSQKVRDAYIGRDALIDRRIVAGGSAGSTSTDTGAGTSPTLSVDGNDICGAILLTTGTTPATNSKILDVTLAAAFANYPIVILQAGNAAAAIAIAEGRVFVDDGAAATNKFTLKSGAIALSASTDYVFYYHCMGF